jgi:hypothetical protein
MDRLAEGLAWIERMLPVRDGLPVAALTEALGAAAGFTYRLGDDLERGQALAQELLTRARAEGYPYGEYWARYVLGALARERGDLVAARRFFAQARDLAPAIRNSDNHVAIALHDLGEVPSARASQPPPRGIGRRRYGSATGPAMSGSSGTPPPIWGGH